MTSTSMSAAIIGIILFDIEGLAARLVMAAATIKELQPSHLQSIDWSKNTAQITAEKTCTTTLLRQLYHTQTLPPE